jgi:uncharacterized membrane protein
MNTYVSRGLWGLVAFLSVGVAVFSYRFLSPTPAVASPEILGNLFARPWLAIHVGGAATALLIGGFQLLPALRRRRSVHRWLGRVYAVGCIVGGLAGLRLAFGTTAGTFAGVGFGLLAVCWIYATTQAWRYARERRFDEHREWMVRSFAMTFAAVTLRLYLPIAPMLGYEFMEGYRLTAWVSWIPNLIIAELYLMRGRRRLSLRPAE